MNPIPANGAYRLFHEFAHRYDLHTPPGHYRHDHAFVIGEALRVAPANCRLLDVGCGTGVFLEAAIAAGIDGHGIDASPEMVKVARQRLGSDRVRVQRMQEISDENAYDVVSVISCTIHYCETAAELDDVLRRCRNALRPSGLLLVQVVNDEQMTGAVNVDRESGPSGEPDDTFFIHQFLPLHDADHSAIANYVYASHAYNELVSERHELRFANAPVTADALRRVGFQEVTVIGSSSISPFVLGRHSRRESEAPPEGATVQNLISNLYQAGKDTHPLSPGNLSPTEARIIREIEQRIAEVWSIGRPVREGDTYLARADERHRRVLLLDGGRGTGKTSVLVTLVRRWNPPACADYNQLLGLRPDYIRVLPILDFDPLPPGMPLAAGIIQAWRPLVNHYADISRKSAESREDESDTLLDRWHRLFRVAAVGWTKIPQGAGLIEQVLDREEQVGEWQHLHRQWYDFVEDIIDFGSKHVPQPAKPLPKNPVFVIMIDDVDLQVSRVRELLPALRLLYHPSVVFIVAAHREHLIDMLKLDFLGQQYKVARFSERGEPLWRVADSDRWSGALASSAVEKVFSTRDRWKLESLSLAEWLEFPGGSFTFRQVLDSRGTPPETANPVESAYKDEALGEYIRSFAKITEKQGLGRITVMPYRKAQQLADEVFAAKTLPGIPEATTLLRRLLDPSESEVVVVSGKGVPPVVEFRAVGEVTALFLPELIEVIHSRLQEIVLSATSRFKFRSEVDSTALGENRAQSADMLEASSLLAISLQDSNRGVVAPGLKWEARLSLAWTRWVIKDQSIDAAFRWLLHALPTPLRLLEWAAEWGEFIKELASEARDRRDRMAYGWIYHQLRWLGGSLDGIDDPMHANLDESNVWDCLLSKEPPPDTDSKLGKDRWRRRTLPLLARPEIGLTPKVQERLLTASVTSQSSKELVAERRRLVRDALDAAAVSRGERMKGGPEEETIVNSVLAEIYRQYERAPWYQSIEKPPESSSPGVGALDNAR